MTNLFADSPQICIMSLDGTYDGLVHAILCIDGSQLFVKILSLLHFVDSCGVNANEET